MRSPPSINSSVIQAMHILPFTEWHVVRMRRMDMVQVIHLFCACVIFYEQVRLWCRLHIYIVLIAVLWFKLRLSKEEMSRLPEPVLEPASKRGGL